MRDDSTQRELWIDVDSALLKHRKLRDKTGNDVLNRLVKKLRDRGEQGIPDERLGIHNCQLKVEFLATEELSRFERHSKTNPYCETSPIILVAFDKQRHLLDGGRRINKWVAESSANRHRTIVIQYALLS
ncbi:MAG: hypothetical protein IH991_03195 [Planctomycetes bacterium]|nr:hypothetical protein [Planctomycetota bacterium]